MKGIRTVPMVSPTRSSSGSLDLGVKLDEIETNAELKVGNKKGEEIQLDNSQDLEFESEIPKLDQQREIITKLLKSDVEKAKEGDMVYIIPQSWYKSFFETEIDGTENLGPIDTSLICRNYSNFILADYESFPYLSVPKSVFGKLIEWYGLAPGSQPVMTYLIYDEETKSLVTEYNRCILKLHYLVVNDVNKRFNNIRPIFLSMSSLSSIKDVVSKILDAFFEREASLDIAQSKFKLWYVKDSDVNEPKSILQSSYKLNPFQFMELPVKTHITPKMFNHTLKALKIFAGSFVIEVKQAGENYHWASNYYMYNDLGSSNGTMGLVNLGNTCYMNSALQCLVHIPQLRDYFLYSGYEQEINMSNPLGHKGHIARAFSLLIQNLFGDKISNASGSHSAYAPSNFKTTIGHLNSMFSGYMQQDSQEFIAFLLDGLHEDLNRIVDKPYIEKPCLSPNEDVHDFSVLKRLADETWDKHLMRNDSVITDLFVGLYESVLHCPECDNVSITFDPYNDLTLPLPVNTTWHTTVVIIPQNSPPCSLEVQLVPSATYQALKSYVAEHAKMDPENLYGCEIFNHQFYTNYESPGSNSQFLPLSELISESDAVVFYELCAATGDIIVPVLNTRIEKGFKTPRLFGTPFFIVLSPEEISNPGCIRLKLEKCYSNLSGGFVEFPLTSLEGRNSIDSMPLIQEVYPKVDFEKLNDVIQYSISNDVDLNEFFLIKLLSTSNNHQKPLGDEPGDNATDSGAELWTPPARMNLSRSKDISEKLSPVVNAIYNYPAFKKGFIQKLNEEKGINAGDIAADDGDLSSNNERHYQKSDVFDFTNSSENQQMPKTDKGKVDCTEIDNSDALKHRVVGEDTVILCEWEHSSLEEVFSDVQPINWETPGKLINDELELQKRQKCLQEEKKITLHDCLKLFSKREVLGLSDLWYCPTCKDHRQATKQIQLWNVPDVLLIHLKRFENQRSLSDKIDDVVHFPIVDLDMSEYLVNKNDPRGSVYDLIAVDNHFGGLGGGHYTAYVKNCADGKWYYFDDSRVTVTKPEQSIAGSAYLLFYLRRNKSQKLGSQRLQEIIEQSRKEYNFKIEEMKERQRYLYETNKTDSDGETQSGDESSDVDVNVEDYNENKIGMIENCREQNAETNTGSISSNDNLGSTRSTDYSIESLEVGRADQTEYCDGNESNTGRRKLRLINKKYNEPSIGTSPASLVSSDDADSICMDLTEPKYNDGLFRKLP